MTFPRIAVHTGKTVVANNKHPRWNGTVVIQHNETTATILRHGPKMRKSVKERHPLLSTFQSNCEAEHWADYNGNDLYANLVIKDGQIVVPTPTDLLAQVARPVEVEETVRPMGRNYHV